jgi:ribonuclease Z
MDQREPHKLEHCTIIQLSNPSKWTLQGYSKAGDRTGFLLRPAKIIIDGGVVTSIVANAGVLTHSHCDHTLSLPMLFSRRAHKLKGQEKLMGRPLFMPQACLVPIQKYMESVILLSDNDSEKYDIVDFTDPDEICKEQGYHPVIVKAGDSQLIPGVPNIKVEVMRAYHNTECNGYGFSSTKKKLKPEYQGVPGKEIGAAKKKGIVVEDEIITPEFVFYCDSTIKNLTDHEEWKKYPIVVCECTGFPETHSAEQMTARHHTHLDQLMPIMKKHKDKQWILIHTSQAIKSEKLDEYQTKLNDDGINIIFCK